MEKIIVIAKATKKADKLQRESPTMDADEKTVKRYKTKEEAVEAIEFWEKEGYVESYEIFKSI